ncbi:MAG: DUF349 domain-containing protein [Burkholderiaceae bacterium]|nr:DUF349 domain-containing protein [Burkholderiaceae bacterium]
MLNRLLGTASHEDPDPAQRLRAVAELPPEAPALARLLASDPAAEVRAAAAQRCRDPQVLAVAWANEQEPRVRAALAVALACHAMDEGLQREAIAAVDNEEALVEIALRAERASARLAAAERVQGEAALRRLYEGARERDRGVARLARQRLDSLERRARQVAEADALLAEAEALASRPGPIVMTAVELDRRWRALALTDDAARVARWEEVSARLRARFERELEQQRARAAFQRRVQEWLQGLQPTADPQAITQLQAECEALRAQAHEWQDDAALARLAQAQQQLAQWEQLAPALASAEALVAEAERLAAGTGIDDAQLPRRWAALDLAVRTPELTRRFEAALLVIERRRLAVARAAEQEAAAARQRLHAQLHAAEQALAAGQLQAARAAADEARVLRRVAGQLPKPTLQRLARALQQLRELERWQHFGQLTARLQLCEQAEALGQQELPPPVLAREVQQLRAQWKKLDEQHAGVPKSLWQRFDAACEKAYAPAARYFAELAARQKEARARREQFIEAAATRVATLLTEPRDWRALERWLRETEAAWHGSELGGVEPAIWKALDRRLRETLAPAREALAAARAQAKSERMALVEQAQAIAAQPLTREAPARIKALQAQWQAQAKQLPLSPRDERALWEQFRAVCNAVFEARAAQRRDSEQKQQERRHAFEAICERLEALARAEDADEAALREARQQAQPQWDAAVAQHGAPPAALQGRFRAARAALQEALAARVQRQEDARWQAVLEKERLCTELDALVRDDRDDEAARAAIVARWAQVPAVGAAAERRLVARRDAALAALARLREDYVREDYLEDMQRAAEARRDLLLELELLLALDSPPDLQAQRLAVQARQLRERFKTGARRGAGSARDLLLDWCALPGIAEERDRQRVDRIVALLVRQQAQ